jgi:hypothetical protein
VAIAEKKVVQYFYHEKITAFWDTMPCSTVEVDRRFRVSRQEVTDKSYIKRYIYVFHYLRSIAIRMPTILTVALAWYV